MCLSKKETEASRTVSLSWLCNYIHGENSWRKFWALHQCPPIQRGAMWENGRARNCLRVEIPGSWDLGRQETTVLGSLSSWWGTGLTRRAGTHRRSSPGGESLTTRTCQLLTAQTCATRRLWLSVLQSLPETHYCLSLAQETQCFPISPASKNKGFSFISFLSAVFRFLHPPRPCLPTSTQQWTPFQWETHGAICWGWSLRVRIYPCG